MKSKTCNQELPTGAISCSVCDSKSQNSTEGKEATSAVLLDAETSFSDEGDDMADFDELGQQGLLDAIEARINEDPVVDIVLQLVELFPECDHTIDRISGILRALEGRAKDGGELYLISEVWLRIGKHEEAERLYNRSLDGEESDDHRKMSEIESMIDQGKSVSDISLHLDNLESVCDELAERRQAVLRRLEDRTNDTEDLRILAECWRVIGDLKQADRLYWKSFGQKPDCDG
jgi:hypothetical protein